MAIYTNLFKLSSRNAGPVKFSDAFKICAKHFASSAYDPDGKTVINILNIDKDAPLMIDGYSALGFRLNNGFFVVGPVAIFPRSILSWNIENDKDINERSLSLFLNLSPKLDVFLIGLSDPNDEKLILDTRNIMYNLMRSKGMRKMNVEVLPTEKAVTTFNFLNCENRFVGAALVPPVAFSPTLDDHFRVEYLTKKKDSLEVFLDK